MQRTLVLALAATLALAGGAAAVGSQLSEFAQSTAANEPQQYAPHGPPAPGGLAPWLADWDPLGKAGDVAGGAKDAALSEKSDAVGMANGAAGEAASLASEAIGGEHGDLAATAALLLDGDAAGASGANDLLATHAMGLRLPSDALPATGAPGAQPAPLPDPRPERPTGALATFAPPGLDFGFAPTPEELRSSRDAAWTWAGEDAAFAAARYGEAYADARAFADTAAAFTFGTAYGAGDTALGAAGLTPLDDIAGNAGLPWPGGVAAFAQAVFGGTLPFDEAGHPQVVHFGVGLVQTLLPLADPFPAYPAPGVLEEGFALGLEPLPAPETPGFPEPPAPPVPTLPGLPGAQPEPEP